MRSSIVWSLTSSMDASLSPRSIKDVTLSQPVMVISTVINNTRPKPTASLRLTLMFPRAWVNQRGIVQLLVANNCRRSPTSAVRRETKGAGPSNGGLEKAGEKGGYSSLDTQDALAKLHRLQAGLVQQVDFIRNPAA